MKQLEEQLEGALLERQGRRLVPTELGRIVYAYAEEIFPRGVELMSVLRGARTRGRRSVTIGVAGGTGSFGQKFADIVLRESVIKTAALAAGLALALVFAVDAGLAVAVGLALATDLTLAAGLALAFAAAVPAAVLLRAPPALQGRLVKQLSKLVK